MRIDASELLGEHWRNSEHTGILLLDEENNLFITASGSEPSTPPAPSTLNPTSTFISRIESWCLNLNSRDAKVLNASYWIFMVLSCITFITSHWSTFLAFLIPALIMNHLRVLRRAWKTASTCHSGRSMSGT